MRKTTWICDWHGPDWLPKNIFESSVDTVPLICLNLLNRKNLERNDSLMKTLKIITSIATVVLFAAAGQAQLSDNFDSYVDKAAFDAVWTPSTGAGLGLNTSEYVTSPNSVKNATTSAAASRQYFTTSEFGQLDFQFSFYDYLVTTGARDYGMLYSRAGTEWTGGLNQLVAIGKYNAGGQDRYYGRVAMGSGTAVLGDGAISVGTGWFYLNNGPAQSVGWHDARVIGQDDPNNPGMMMFKFYIDGILGGSVANVASESFNWAVLGSGLSSSGGFIAFDDLSVVQIPEPSSVALFLLGGIGLAAGVISRRRKV